MTFYLLSASRDDQESDDSVNTFKLPNRLGGGAFTTNLYKILNSKPTSLLSYGEVLSLVRKELKNNGHTQIPQLSSTSFVNAKDNFLLSPVLYRRKLALLIGINYVGQEGELYGCHNDVRIAKKFLVENLTFIDNNIMILMDDNYHKRPIRENIENAITNICETASRGDLVWIHYSGHGRFIRDLSGDEKDGYDETLVPLDFRSKGEMKDDDLKQLLVLPMAEGVTVMIIMDCCHSGTILDLPFRIS